MNIVWVGKTKNDQCLKTEVLMTNVWIMESWNDRCQKTGRDGCVFDLNIGPEKYFD